MSDVDRDEVARAAAPRSDTDLYALHAPELVRYATVLVGPHDADDLVADAVANAFAHPNWSGVEHRRAYLYRAVLNQARQTERSRARRRRRERRVAVRESVPASEVRPEVLAAVQSLPARQRAIVFFTYWQDRSVNDIAAELDVTARTVQRELAEARAHLQERLR